MLSRRKTFCLAIVLSALMGCNGNWNSGDRVLVEKFPYDAGVGKPKRFDVVVFRFPGTAGSPGPTENNVPKNYIKRLMGLPGQLLAIFFGQIFCFEPPQDEPFFEDKDDPTKLWEQEYMHINHPRSLNKWEEPGMFKIVRKSPEVMLAMRRIVSDNDFQPPESDHMPPRWLPTQGWKVDKDHGFDHAGNNQEGIDWIHYQHILYPWPQKIWPEEMQTPRKELVVDFMGYNSHIPNNVDIRRNANWDIRRNANWVGNFMIECQVKVTQAEGEFWLELNKGINRFQACFDLASGKCTLSKLAMDGTKTKLGEVGTRVKGPGQYNVRFANFDARLTVWVDDDLPFGEGKDYPPPEVRGEGEEHLTEKALLERRGPRENDLKPASIGSKGARVHVQKISLWRDTYYTTDLTEHLCPDWQTRPDEPNIDWGNDKEWGRLCKLPVRIMYVQPGHYLCLGDNSSASSDSRYWGLVPERLLLGRALMVYWPTDRAGPIR